MLVGFTVVTLLLLKHVYGMQDEHPLMQPRNFLLVVCSLVASLEPELLGLQERRVGYVHRTRNRKYVNDIFNELGPHYVRRAYRMEPSSFWKLCRMLRPLLTKTSPSKKNRNGAKNGIIPTPTKISSAIRYFAGGSPYDISVVHGISHTEVFRCVWAVVDAINSCENLAFRYPEEHEEQQRIADGFSTVSRGVLKCCAGAIDGILIWIEKPSEAHCEISECSAKKFFCGRKKKFGLNMQATCDHNKKFLDIYIGHPASTSDYLAFSSSPLFFKLEKEGFMKPGLCLFGDNAYVNTVYMATPYKSVKEGEKDAYNYFHSNVRITIECAFGMLVHRWGILCKPMSTKLPIAKVTSMVRALCRLHNFCIDEKIMRDEAGGVLGSPLEQTDQEVADHLEADNMNIILGGGSSIVEGDFSPEALLHGGEHFDDVSRAVRISRKAVSESLPRELMCEVVQRLGLRRPTPNTWVGRTPACMKE